MAAEKPMGMGVNAHSVTWPLLIARHAEAFLSGVRSVLREQAPVPTCLPLGPRCSLRTGLLQKSVTARPEIGSSPHWIKLCYLVLFQDVFFLGTSFSRNNLY